jgi:hypothetical protein
MRWRAAYDAGAASMRRYPGTGAMMFNDQLTRAENMVAQVTPAIDRAANSVKGVKGALVANAVVTGVSTLVLVTSALRARKAARRG